VSDHIKCRYGCSKPLEETGGRVEEGSLGKRSYTSSVEKDDVYVRLRMCCRGEKSQPKKMPGNYGTLRKGNKGEIIFWHRCRVSRERGMTRLVEREADVQGKPIKALLGQFRGKRVAGGCILTIGGHREF